MAAGRNFDTVISVCTTVHPMIDLQRHDAGTSLVFVRGEELYVHHEAGHFYQEGVSGLWSVTRGFHTERLAAAKHRQVCHYWRFGQPSETEEQFATRLADELGQMFLAERRKRPPSLPSW